MSLPTLTHLQFQVLSILGPREKSGLEIRQALGQEGLRMSGPAFYQLMARLEPELAEGRYVERVIDGHRVRERRYRITGVGALACEAALAFYSRQIDRTQSLAEDTNHG